jgi:hypothetical protein
MAEKEKDSGKVGAGLLGATAGAILTALLTMGRKAQAAPPEGTTVFTPDEETWNLLVGILQGIVDLGGKADDLMLAINNLSMSLGGFPLLKNPKSGVTDHVICSTVGVAVQLPDYVVPFDKIVAVKALNTNASPCRVAFSKVDAENLTAAWPLIRNEGKGWKVDNVNRLWVCFAAPTDGVAWSVEQE